MRLSLLLLVCASAMLRAFALPGWFWAGLVVPALLLRIAWWERGGSKRGDYLGGVLYWTLCFSFLSNVHWVAPLGAALILGWLWVLQGVLYRRLRPWMSPGFAGPSAILVVEWIRSWFPLGGVPWGSWAHGFSELAWARTLGSQIGEFGVATLILYAAGWFWILSTRRSVLTLLPLPLVFAFLLLRGQEHPQPEAPISCLAVQGNISLTDKHDLESSFEVYLRHLELTEEALLQGSEPDLILWAETMWPYPAVSNQIAGELRRPWPGLPVEKIPASDVLELQQVGVSRVLQEAPDHSLFVLGSHYYEGVQVDADPEVMSPRTSEVLAFNKEGQLKSHCTKGELVPFGERLPLMGNFPFSHEVAQAVFATFGLLPDFQLTDRQGPLDLSLGEQGRCKLGVAVCWENVFPHIFRSQAMGGAEAFVILSNEAWYGISAEFVQMLASTRWRSAETGRPILRVTNTGVTSLISESGKKLDFIPFDTAQAWSVELPRVHSDTSTPYLRGGWALFPGLALLLLTLACFPRRTTESREGKSFA